MTAFTLSGSFVYQPTGVFDVVLVVVDDEGNPALAGDAKLSLAVVLSYPDQFGQQVELDLFVVDPFGYGGVRVGATWPGDGPELPEGWSPAALLATVVTSGYFGYSAVITAAQPAQADSGILLVRPAPGPRFPAPEA